MSKKFNFFCPAEIHKAKNEDGEEVMRLGGIASTMDEDSDGEFLDPSGFEIEDFLKLGVVNWHHQSSDSPSKIIGEPSRAEIRKDGFYVECDLYKSSQMAREVFDLAQVMASDSKSRKLGYSIEGVVIDRDVANPKIVKKAKITGLAITHMPKNPQTFANIIKGHVNNDLNEEEEEQDEKGLSTESGAAVIPESVDGSKKKKHLKNCAGKTNYIVKSLEDEEMYDLIFDTFTNISVEKAEKVYNIFNKIKDKMEKGENISEEKLQKAMDLLDLPISEENPFLEKGEKMSPEEAAKKRQKDMMNDDFIEDEENIKKGKTMKKDHGDIEDEVEDVEDEMEDVEDEAEDVKEKVEAKKEKKEDVIAGKDKDIKKAATNPSRAMVKILQKAITQSSEENKDFNRAVGTLVKASLESQEDLNRKIDALEKANTALVADLKDAIGSLHQRGQEPMGRKSITKSYREKESFQKGEEEKVLSKSRDRGQVLEILDSACFAKGYDQEFAKAVTSFEATKQIPNNIIQRIKSEMGVNIVD